MVKEKNNKSFIGDFLWKSSLGFTLVEILIVIVIVGILTAGAISVINPLDQLQKAHDAKRKSDLTQVQKALELYSNDVGSYPEIASPSDYRIKGFDDFPVAWGEQWTPYMETLPKDPSSSKNYVYVSNGRIYYLYASLDRGGKDFQACKVDGSACDSAIENGVENACGGACNYEAQINIVE